MSVLNDLIRIKTSVQKDDLIKMLDEIPVYEKLSVNEQFKDLKTSEITRSKCPMLAAFVDNKPYETILADLAANIYLQIEGNIPEIFNTVVERTPKQQRQFEILQSGVARVEYLDITEYDHDEMSESIAAIFSKQTGSVITIAIIVHGLNGYEMYHGSYEVGESEAVTTKLSNPITIRGHKGVFIMGTYSMLGNNGYRFSQYNIGQDSYDVMISPDDELFLMDGDRIAVNHTISHEERNALNVAKKDPEEYAKLVLSIIESVV